MKQALGLLMILVLSQPAVAQLEEGDLLVADAGAGIDFRGGLFKVDPITGIRVLLSDFGDPAQGPLGVNQRGVAYDPELGLFAVDPFAGVNGLGLLFRIDPTTGQRTVVSDFADADQGLLGTFPISTVFNADGHLLVTDSSIGVIFAVDITTGQRSVISDFLDGAQGPIGSPTWLAIDAGGDLWATGGGGEARLYRIDPDDGSRVIASDFADSAQGETAFFVGGVAVEATGTVLVTGPGGGGESGRIFRVDPDTGERTVLSDFAPFSTTALNLAIERNGDLVVPAGDFFFGIPGSLYRADGLSGETTLLSWFGDPDFGPLGSAPIGITVVKVSEIFDDGFESGDLSGWSAGGARRERAHLR